MKRILIVKMWALGDILMATPLLTALRQAFPSIQIDWLLDATHADILKDHPLIDELMILDTGQWRRKLRRGDVYSWLRESHDLRQNLDARGYDAVINCHPDKWWTAILCPAPIRVGLFPSDQPGPQSRAYSHVLPRGLNPKLHNTDHYLLAAEAVGARGPHDTRIALHVRDEDRRSVRDFLRAQSDFEASKPAVILHPGTSQSSKCWLPENFISVASQLVYENNILVTGSRKEEALVKKIVEGCEGAIAAVMDGIGGTMALIEQVTGGRHGRYFHPSYRFGSGHPACRHLRLDASRRQCPFVRTECPFVRRPCSLRSLP